jgi:hypothetical protein
MAVAQVYWEKDGEERESESNKRERRKRGAWRLGAALEGSSRPQGGKQEVEHDGHAQDMQVLPTGRRRKEFFFCRKPPRVWKIPGKNKKIAHFCKIWHFKWCAKF